MVKVEVKNGQIKEPEMHIMDALADTIKNDLNGLQCDHCKEESLVYLEVDKKKLTSLSVKVAACCIGFKKKIESILYLDEKVL